ncbi:DUF732 domain-containing protein [Mycobacterium sp. Aquia_213]|uniref:DUF732 domain-containing protein n=1 Tax=Mycobacterium sp. Aquia_213 TaxID=2991728 RepID=UPI00227202FA|nr:DUF732 domain-containing protein [Mycobacterium sp. Aquia_213]WAC89722.1 DUF732 domain-containing protein [Mycobacterium sp. Aquia_213]
MKTALAASSIALSALLWSVPAVANAEPENTADYISYLDQNNIKYANHDSIVHIGTNLCNELRNNLLPPDQALQRIQNMGYSQQQTKVIAFAAVEAFCPDMDIDAQKAPKS